jgi:hypothetical protein
MPLASSLTLTATSARRVHALRSRNVNAPLADGSRPLGTGGEVFQIESSGISDTRQLTVNTTHNVGAAAVLWTSYTLSHVRSDTGGSMNFPADTYDLRGEYGLSESVARNTFYFGGWIRCFGGLEFTPLIMWRSGLPFNITTGQDRNGDTQFMERPAFAVNPNQPGVIVTRYGAFDLEPVPGQSMIPRNFGIGPRAEDSWSYHRYRSITS